MDDRRVASGARRIRFVGQLMSLGPDRLSPSARARLAGAGGLVTATALIGVSFAQLNDSLRADRAGPTPGDEQLAARQRRPPSRTVRVKRYAPSLGSAPVIRLPAARARRHVRRHPRPRPPVTRHVAPVVAEVVPP